MHFFHLKKYWFIFLVTLLFIPNLLNAAVCTADKYNAGSVTPIFGTVDFTNETQLSKPTPQPDASGKIAKPDKDGKYKPDQKFTRCNFATESFFSSALCYIQDDFNGALFKLSCKLCYDLKEFFNIAIQLFLAIYAVGFMTGVVQQKIGEFIKTAIKLSIVLILFNNHDAFYEIVYKGFMSLSRMVYCLGVSDAGCGSKNIFADLDSFFKLLTGNGFDEKGIVVTMLAVVMVTWFFGWPLVMMGILFFGVIVTFRVVLRFFVGVILAILMLSMLLAFFCVFLIFFLFPFTKAFWDRYFTNLATYAAEPLFAVIALYFILQTNILPTAMKKWQEGIGPIIENQSLVIIPNAEHCNNPDKYRFAWGKECPGTIKNSTNNIGVRFVDKFINPLSLSIGGVPLLEHYECKDPSNIKKCICNKTANGVTVYCNDVMMYTIAFVLLFIIFVLSIESILKANTLLVTHLTRALGVSLGGQAAASASAPLAIDLGGEAGRANYTAREVATRQSTRGVQGAQYLVRGGLPFGQMSKDVSLMRRLPGLRDADNTLQNLPTQKGARGTTRAINNTIRTALAFNPISAIANTISDSKTISSNADYAKKLEELKKTYEKYNDGESLNINETNKINELRNEATRLAIELNIISNNNEVMDEVKKVELQQLEAATISLLSKDRQEAYNTLQNAKQLQEILNNSNDTFAQSRTQELLDKMQEAFDNKNISDQRLRALNLTLTTEGLSSDNLRSTIKAFYDAQRDDQLARAAEMGPEELRRVESIFANANTFESQFLNKALSQADRESRQGIDNDYYNPGITLDLSGKNTQQRVEMYSKVANSLDRIIKNGAIDFFA